MVNPLTRSNLDYKRSSLPPDEEEKLFPIKFRRKIRICGIKVNLCHICAPA